MPYYIQCERSRQKAGLGRQGAAGRLTILLRKATRDLRKRASQGAGRAGTAQAAVLSLKDAIIRRSGQDEWRTLWDEVKANRERAREIRRARQRFAAAARPVRQPQCPR